MSSLLQLWVRHLHLIHERCRDPLATRSQLRRQVLQDKPAKVPMSLNMCASSLAQVRTWRSARVQTALAKLLQAQECRLSRQAQVMTFMSRLSSRSGAASLVLLFGCPALTQVDKAGHDVPCHFALQCSALPLCSLALPVACRSWSMYKSR